VDFRNLAIVSAALQKQVVRDLERHWDIVATVDAFANLEDVPTGYWPIVVKDDIGFDAAGIHLDKDGQPFALVSSGQDWSLTASHEILEMLVDPFGNRLVAGQSPEPGQGRVEFLVEVSDPSEAAEFGYTVNGVLVSDFYTPRFFDPVTSNGVQYSQTGAIRAPRTILKGGYISWHDPVGDHWFQHTWFGGTKPALRDLGVFERQAGGIRSHIDTLTAEFRARSEGNGDGKGPKGAKGSKGGKGPKGGKGGTGQRLEVGQASIAALTATAPAGNKPVQSQTPEVRAASTAKAATWRAQIAALTGGNG
jgi:hypothetical protein